MPAPGPPIASVPVLGRTTTAAPTLAGAAEFYWLDDVCGVPMHRQWAEMRVKTGACNKAGTAQGPQAQRPGDMGGASARRPR